MNKEVKFKILNMKGFYLLTFLGFGSLSPLLSVYLSQVEHLNGYQIGTIMSVGPIMMIFFQPIWGMISDKTNSPIKVLMITTLISGILSLCFLVFHSYYWFLFVAVFVSLFQSAIIPISDSISLNYTSKVKVNYGNIRLYGSLGFGLAVFIMGRLSDINETVIFYAYFIALTASAILAYQLPCEKTSENKRVLSGMKEIFTYKKFFIFLIITFLIFGPNLANNVYFGLFVEDRGGTYTGIGMAFLIAVLSEIPFMQLAGRWIHRFGLLPIATLAGIVSLVRWVLYFTEPDLFLVYVSAVLQGASVGLFIPAGLQYIREITPPHITATAVTIYSAIGNGLGNWFSTFLGGVIFELFNIAAVYLFFGLLASIGVVLNIVLINIEKKGHLPREILLKNS